MNVSAQAPTLTDPKLPGGIDSTCIVASPVLRLDQPDGGKRCIVLESGPTRSLVAKLPQRSSLSVREFRTAN